MNQQEKEMLLATKMDKIGLGEKEVRRLYYPYMDPHKNPKNYWKAHWDSIHQDDIPTVKEFFELNASCLATYRQYPLIIAKKEGCRKLKPSSRVYKAIIAFLKDKGFTYEDWIGLLPRRADGLPRLDLLSVEQLKKLPLCQVCGLKPGKKIFKQIAAYILEYPACRTFHAYKVMLRALDADIDRIASIPAEKILAWGEKTFEDFVEKYKLSRAKRRATARSLGNMCRNLKRLGFDESHGAFLSNRLKSG